MNGSGEQLICTKDTTPPCFTDKFPYCLSACLDGYTRNASGQCVSTVATATNSTGEQWEAYHDPVYPNRIGLTKLPIAPTVVPG